MEVTDMIFRKEVYLTRDMNEYNRAKDVLADQGDWVYFQVESDDKSGKISWNAIH